VYQESRRTQYLLEIPYHEATFDTEEPPIETKASLSRYFIIMGLVTERKGSLPPGYHTQRQTTGKEYLPRCLCTW